MNSWTSRSIVRDAKLFAHLSIFLVAVAAEGMAQTVVTRGSELTLDVSATRDSIVFDLLGDLWTIPVRGGAARRLTETDRDLKQPRWSPDGSQVAFEEHSGSRVSIGLVPATGGEHRLLTRSGRDARDPSWHPSGERLVFSARERRGGFDLWEIDLATGLEWRLTEAPGDETDAAWSADGRDLVYVSRTRDGWTLTMKEFAKPPRALVESMTPISAPSWRPDGTLITYFHKHDGHHDLRMLILSEPALDRVLSENNGLFPDPVSWLDRGRLYYSGGESIRTREFDDWTGKGLMFRASLAPVNTEPRPDAPRFQVAQREIAAIDAPADKLVVRADRLFDGQSANYLTGIDVLIENGLIADVTATRDWDGLPVINLPGTTLIPGLIDVHAFVPDDLAEGASILAWGVTTLVGEKPEPLNDEHWHGDENPGPRVLAAHALADHFPADEEADTPLPFLVVAGDSASEQDQSRVEQWQAKGVPVLGAEWAQSETLGSSMLPAAETASARSRPIPSDMRPENDIGGRILLSGLADRHTPGLRELLRARQLGGKQPSPPTATRIPLLGDLRRSRAPVVASSSANGLPPGAALHAELLAMQAAGLSPEVALKAAGREAARAIGLGGRLGEITVGAMADLVLVQGDPLADIGDARNVVGVVRNGRFFSLVSLLERSSTSVGLFDNNENGNLTRQTAPLPAAEIGR